MSYINIAKEFSTAPGSRKRSEGPHSGEEFLETQLLPKYTEAVQAGLPLCIDLDGGSGYGAGFLEEAFGGLARAFTPEKILDRLLFTSIEEPYLIEEIKGYIKEANGDAPESKKTPCKKCGGFRFEQRYHAIVKDIGYIDGNGDFTAVSSDAIEVTNGIELFECFDCSESVEIKDDDDEDEDEE